MLDYKLDSHIKDALRIAREAVMAYNRRTDVIERDNVWRNDERKNNEGS